MNPTYTDQQANDLLAILLSPAPVEAPKPTPRKRTVRHFYRCKDCLTVVVLEAKLGYKKDAHGYRTDALDAVCDACGGKFEYMGETVSAHTLRRVDHYAPACDGRCTSAVGPSCDCICGGENHGTGRVVPVYTDSDVPRVMVPKAAAQKAEQYRTLCAQFRAAWDARYKDVTERKRYEYLSGGAYGVYMDGQHAWGEYLSVKTLRTHATRNRRLTALITEAGGKVTRFPSPSAHPTECMVPHVTDCDGVK